MDKVIFLRLGQGNLQTGFPDVEVRLQHSSHLIAQKPGFLPSSPELANLLNDWQFLYKAFYEQSHYQLRGKVVDGIELEESGTTSFSKREFKQVASDLTSQMRAWLNSPGVIDINNVLRTKLQEGEEIQIIVETSDSEVERLPWHCWRFLEDYRKAEVSFGLPEFDQKNPQIHHHKPRVLVVLGKREDIDTAEEESLLQQLGLEVRFLTEPTLNELIRCLRDPNGWDLFFFAGHSSSQLEGQMCLNGTEWVTIAGFKHALEKAIEHGLQLAIFNSCDGSRLARDLVDLDIPVVIVMKEPVPNRVAQTFLKSLLENFSQGVSLHCAVREARQSLEGIELSFPCASWLPSMWLNPAAKVPSWQDLSGRNPAIPFTEISPVRESSPENRLLKQVSLRSLFAISLVVTGLVMGVRSQGLFRQSELKAFDHLMRLRAPEGADPRLVIIKITDADKQEQLKRQEPGDGSLHDPTLQKLITVLDKYKPRVIGLDLLRDQPMTPNYEPLRHRLQNNSLSPVIGICQHARLWADPPEPGTFKPPDIPTDRIGFNDVSYDNDGVVRRYLLKLDLPVSRCQSSNSFGLQLAVSYLKRENIQVSYTPTKGSLKLGNVIFKRLESHVGGYQNSSLVNADINQILLNYRPYRQLNDIAVSIPLQQVLDEQFNPTFIKDRIVLIGRTDIDLFTTPYNAEKASLETAGVYLHAQAVSQILAAVLNQRRLIWWLPAWGEVLWVWVWSAIGGLIAWGAMATGKLQQLRWWGLLSGTMLALYTFCWISMQWSGWLPLIPAMCVLVATNGVVIAMDRWRKTRR